MRGKGVTLNTVDGRRTHRADQGGDVPGGGAFERSQLLPIQVDGIQRYFPESVIAGDAMVSMCGVVGIDRCNTHAG